MDSMVALAFWVTQPIWQMNKYSKPHSMVCCQHEFLGPKFVRFFFPSIALSLCFLCSIMLFFSSFFHHYLQVLRFLLHHCLCVPSSFSIIISLNGGVVLLRPHHACVCFVLSFLFHIT
ncbi:hypothetical protein Peur_026716 [Populus x canadensis]